MHIDAASTYTMIVIVGFTAGYVATTWYRDWRWHRMQKRARTRRRF